MLVLGKVLKKKSEEGEATRASATGSGGAGRGSFMHCNVPMGDLSGALLSPCPKGVTASHKWHYEPAQAQ